MANQSFSFEIPLKLGEDIVLTPEKQHFSSPVILELEERNCFSAEQKPSVSEDDDNTVACRRKG